MTGGGRQRCREARVWGLSWTTNQEWWRRVRQSPGWYGRGLREGDRWSITTLHTPSRVVRDRLYGPGLLPLVVCDWTVRTIVGTL